MAAHLRLFRALWVRAVIIMDRVLHTDGIVAIEWPTSCAYWRFRQVKAYIASRGLSLVKIHGCAFGMMNSDGVVVYKPWTIATNSTVLHTGLQPYRCTRDHLHAALEGKETTRSSKYPIKMAKKIHYLFKVAVDGGNGDLKDRPTSSQ